MLHGPAPPAAGSALSPPTLPQPDYYRRVKLFGGRGRRDRQPDLYPIHERLARGGCHPMFMGWPAGVHSEIAHGAQSQWDHALEGPAMRASSSWRLSDLRSSSTLAIRVSSALCSVSTYRARL